MSDELEVYLNEQERLKVAWELLSYAAGLYNRVYVFKNYEAYAESFQLRPPSEAYWEGMSREKLIDEFKICTAFENYNKSVLLSKGYIVHSIVEKKANNLAKRQRVEPVPISQLVENNIDDIVQLNSVLRPNMTVSFSQTLTPPYQNVIGMGERFLGYLKTMNQRRNRLHYNKNYPGAFRVSSHLEMISFAKECGSTLLSNEIKKVDLLLKKFN